MHIRFGAGVVDRIQHREELGGPVAVPERREGDRGPDRRMRVLPAVLSDARHIPLDVAGLEGGAVERRCQEQHDAVSAPHEKIVDGRHGALAACRVPGRRDDAPGLRDRIDAAFVVDGGAEWRPIIEVRAPIPLAVPGLTLERFLQCAPVLTPSLGALALPASVGQVGPSGQNGVQEPPEPDALTLAFGAHLVHPIVPVPRTHQR